MKKRFNASIRFIPGLVLGIVPIKYNSSFELVILLPFIEIELSYTFKKNRNYGKRN
tara:strand:- start:724 stop:891 length:168 start_codon:yes stop_codon:yes gene_type:complete